MKLLKICSISLFILFSLLATPVIAATPSDVVLLASVDIQEAKIISQKDNAFSLSFSLINGEGLQTGVKYSIKLIKQTDKGDFIMDEKIYDESLTLNSNTTLKKDIVYTAPAFLNGEYKLSLVSNNTSGFPFAIADLGKVKLIAIQEGIQISPETCSLSSGGKSYTINQVIEVKTQDAITLTCNAVNLSKKDNDLVIPSYETRERSSYGDVVTEVTGGDVNGISFKAREEKSFSVVLPKAKVPQAYNINVRLDKSNPVNIQYFINGDIGTIMSVSLDKDYYVQGDSAKLSFVYSISSSSPMTANVEIWNDKENACASTTTKALDASLPKADITIPITETCANPKVKLTLTNDKGAVLDQKEFAVKTTSVPTESNSKLPYILIIIVLIIIIIIYIFMKRKKSSQIVPPSNPSMSVPMSVLFFLIITAFGFIPFSKVSAATFSVDTHVVAVVSTSITDIGNNATSWSGAPYIYPSYSTAVSGLLRRTDTGASTSGTMDASYATSTRSVIGPVIRVYNNGSTSSGSVATTLINSNPGMILFKVIFPCSQSEQSNCTALYGTNKTITYGVPFTTYPAPTVNVTASPNPAVYNAKTRITWSSTNALNCTCSTSLYMGCSGFSGSTSGYYDTPTLQSSATFTIACNN